MNVLHINDKYLPQFFEDNNSIYYIVVIGYNSSNIAACRMINLYE